MQFPPLQSATLIRRYKRFMADIELPNGDTATIHCANTGTMLGCGQTGDTIWYSDSKSLTRKYPLSWELTQLGEKQFVCINTHRSNQLTLEALQHKHIKELAEYNEIYTEVKYGEENSRIDILLKQEGLPDCYIEVKSVTLVRQQLGQFPDAVTTRGQKHLRELIHMVEQGKRAVIFFAGLHNGFNQFKVAEDIDPTYNQLLQQAVKKGVEVYCYAGEFSMEKNIPTGLRLSHSVEVII